MKQSFSRFYSENSSQRTKNELGYVGSKEKLDGILKKMQARKLKDCEKAEKWCGVKAEEKMTRQNHEKKKGIKSGNEKCRIFEEIKVKYCLMGVKRLWRK